MQKIYCSILFLVFIFQINAQIVINEYSAANLSSFPDNFAKFEDWIELYNTSGSPVNLTGWYLSDKSTKPIKWPIPEGTILNPFEHKVIWCSGRDTASSEGLHSNFKLTQTKENEVLILTKPNLEIVQEIPLELVQLEHSMCRTKDGSDIWRVCVAPTPDSKNDFSEQRSGYLVEPTLDTEAGFYEGSIVVTMDNPNPNSVMRYTTNGNEPTLFSPIYTDGLEINISETSIVKAKVFSNDSDMLPSKICFATYFIDESFSLPVFSVGADQVQELANGTGFLRPVGTLEYFDQNKDRVASSYGELNRHGQDSWILPHRSIDWISRDEMAYSKDVNAKLFNYSERDSYQRFMFRASGDDNYPANDDNNHVGSCHIRDEYVHALAQNGEMKLDVRAVERVVVFLNGDYWGLYGLRERPADHDYTDEYYDQDKYNIQYLTTWGSTQAEYGGQQAFTDWLEFRDFVLEEDMSIPENYDYVKSQLQVKGLCDYMIANLNSVASDWLNYNTGWWRGLNPEGDHKKWGYILWDNDATFDYYINYSGVPNTDPDAVACDIEDISDYMDFFYAQSEDVGKHEKIFLKLIDESEEFQQLYYSRMADLLNTVYTCENMLMTFDSMVATIEPEMPRQIERWGGSMNEWQSNIATMRGFIEERCTLIDDGMVDCYDLTGPHDLTLMVEPAGYGEIELNTLDITSFPHTGEYFGNMDQKLKAIPVDDTKAFSHWISSSDAAFSPDFENEEVLVATEGPDVLTAVFVDVSSIDNYQANANLLVFPTIVDDQVNINFELEKSSFIDFNIVDIHGKQVDGLADLDGDYSSGEHKMLTEVNDGLISGIYFVQVKTAHFILTEKIIITE